MAPGETGKIFFFQGEDGIRAYKVTGVQTCALPISGPFAFRAHASPPDRKLNRFGLPWLAQNRDRRQERGNRGDSSGPNAGRISRSPSRQSDPSDRKSVV